MSTLFGDNYSDNPFINRIENIVKLRKNIEAYIFEVINYSMHNLTQPHTNSNNKDTKSRSDQI